MFAHIGAQVGGWWAGVLHPMEAPDHLCTLLLVGLLGGLSVRARRSPTSLPVVFVASMLACGLLALALDRSFDVDPVLIVLAATMAAMLFVHPARMGVLGPIVVVASGGLHGLAHSTTPAGTGRSWAYAAGFLFTTGLLLTVGSIVGSTIGRGLGARTVADDRHADADDRMLV